MSFWIRNKRLGEWAKASIKKPNFSTESHRIIISFIFFIFQSIQQETDFFNFDLWPRETSFLIIFSDFWTLTFDLLKSLFSSFFFDFLNFDLWPPETSFLIIFSDFFEFWPLNLLKRLFSSFFRHKRNKRMGRDGRVG